MSSYLISEADDHAWLYVGAELSSSRDLTEDRDFSGITDETQRLAKAVEQQRNWMDLLLDPGVVVDLRYVNDPGSTALRCGVLLRRMVNDRNAAETEADRLTQRVASAPGHLSLSALDEDGLYRFLDPLQSLAPHPQGRAEIRKRTETARPNRPDARVDLYWAVSPFRPGTRSWAPLFQALGTHAHPLCISVLLEPQPRQVGLAEELRKLATFYKRLATEGEDSGTGLYRGKGKLTADAFAVDAEALFSDAARRYEERSHVARIAIASTAALDDGLLALIGTTLSPPDQPHEGMSLTTQLAGASHTVVRPPDEAAEVSFDNNLAALDSEWWAPELPPPPFEGAARIVRLVDTREATAVFRMPIAENGVLPFIPVSRPDFGVAVTQSLAEAESIVLGTQIVSSRDSGELRIARDDLTMHAFVVGTTGSGKTTTVLALLDALWKQGIPWLVIEPVNVEGDDYRWFLDRAGYEDMVVVTAGDERGPLRINPFEVPSGTTVGEHLTAVLACFDAAFGLWDPLPAIYRRALEQTYFEAGYSLDDFGGPTLPWPVVADLTREMHRVTENLDYAGEVRSNIMAASRLRVEQLAGGPLRSVFDCQASTPLDFLLERPCVVELAKVGASNEQEAAFVIAVLLTAIAEHRRGGRPSRELVHVMVVEEAHKLLKAPAVGGGGENRGDPSAAAARMFANLLAEIRKYGEAIVVADQDPAKLVPDAYKNTNLKIMHRLPAEADRKLVGSTMRFDEDHEKEAAGLRRFHAFVHAEGYDRPGLIRAPNIREGAFGELPDGDAVSSAIPGAGRSERASRGLARALRRVRRLPRRVPAPIVGVRRVLPTRHPTRVHGPGRGSRECG